MREPGDDDPLGGARDPVPPQDAIQQALDPNRSLEGWLRAKHGLTDAEIAAVRGDWDKWLEAMRLRQQDPDVRRAQNRRSDAYQAAKALDDARTMAREADAAAKRARGSR